MGKRHNLPQDIAAGARLVGGPSKDHRKSWVFEQLEARHVMSADALASLVGPEFDLTEYVNARAQEVAAMQLAAGADGLSTLNAARASFNDPAFPYQWHLINTAEFPVGSPILQEIFGVPGEDISVEGAWDLGYTGEGVVVAVVDSGIQLDHPDLIANLSKTLGYDAVLDLAASMFPGAGSANQMNPDDAHGTAAAGLIGAVGNNGIGTTGVAHNSTIVPIQLLAGLLDPMADPAIERMFRYENQEIDIYNHSWGPSDAVRTATSINPLILDALRDSVLLGRGGLGNIHVWAGGNGASPTVAGPDFSVVGPWDYAGYDGYVNSRYTIGVTGVDHDGKYSNVDGTATLHWEASPAILVAAPTSSGPNGVGDDIGFGLGTGSGIWTLDFVDTSGANNPLLEGYNAPTLPNGSEANDTIFDRWEDPSVTSRFSGTSASAPIVSGVIALMLEANPNLSYRDVQEILVRSARQNAQFEEPLTGLEQSDGIKRSESWVVNRNEFYHQTDFNGEATVSWYDLFDNPMTDIENDWVEADIGSGATLTYNPDVNPLLDPSGLILVTADGDGNIVPVANTMDPALFANGAGYTVSLGRGFMGSSYGFGHGVVDAELAVKLAEQWTTTDQHLAPEITWTTHPQPVDARYDDIGPRYIGNMASGFLLNPGTFDSVDDAGLINTYFEDVPDFPMTRDAQNDFITLTVPDGPDSTMSVEWVEFKLNLPSGDVDDLRVTLISPDGTQSELTQHFDVPDATFSPQHFLDPINEAGVHSDLVGPPGGGPVGATEYTFSTNRHWGERSNSRTLIDPATGEPYAQQAFIDVNTGEIIAEGAPKRQWQLHIENFGTDAESLSSFELIFHGQPVGEGTKRIQGSVGVDEYRDDDGDGVYEQDGDFNYERWIQWAQDIFNVSTLMPDPDSQFENAVFARLNTLNNHTVTSANGDPITLASESITSGLAFNRLGEIERVADETQEAFAENVTVKLFAERADGAGGFTQADLENDTPVDQFITGADGNYYFDVVPPVALADAEAGDIVSYVVAIEDGEGRTVLNDTNAPADFVPKYRDQWRLTSDYFTSWDQEGVTPTFMDTQLVDGLFDAMGNAVVSASVNPDTGQLEFFDEMENLVDAADLTDVAGNSVDVVALGSPGGAVAQFVVVDQTQFSGVVEGWDPLDMARPTAEATIFTAGDDPMPVIFDPEFEVILNGETLFGPQPAFVVPNEDAESLDFQIITNVNADGSYTTIEVSVEVDDETGMITEVEFEDPEVEDGAVLELYDENGAIVTLGTALDGTPVAVSLSNIRPDITILPVLETYDLELGVDPAYGSTRFIYDPATVYTSLADANGNPLPLSEEVTDVRKINFLLDPGQPADENVSFEGRVFTDANGNGVYDPLSDVAKNDVRVYADINRNGFYDAGIDIDVRTEPDGTYSLTTPVETKQAIAIRVAPQPGFTLSTPSPSDEYVELVEPGDGLVGGGFDFIFAVGGGPGGEDLLGVVAGSVFEDLDSDGVRDATERGLGGVTVYVDRNGNGERDQVDPFAVTNGGGFFEIAAVQAGQNVEVRIETAPPLSQTLPSGDGARVVSVVAGEVTAGVVFGVANPANRDYGDLGVVNGHTYPTTFAQNGASHVAYPEIRLGATIDGDLDGQPSSDARGDDDNSEFGVADDEDGVIADFGLNNWVDPGENLDFEITVAGTGFFLNGWIDFNADGDWDDPGEHIFDDVDLNPGTHVTGNGFLPEVTAPLDTATNTPLAARFRWGHGDLSYSGPATIGEVEDYVYNDPNVSPQVIVGDYDGNGTVNNGDYAVWKSNFGTQSTQTPPGGVTPGDGNRDGVVNMLDYVVWRDGLSMQNAGSLGRSGTDFSANPELEAMLAELGYERVMVTVGHGALTRQVMLWAPIAGNETPHAPTTDATGDGVAAYALSLTQSVGYSQSVVTTGASASGSGLENRSDSVTRASQHDLALVLLDSDKQYDDDSFDFVARGESEEQSEEETPQGALAAAFEEAFA